MCRPGVDAKLSLLADLHRHLGYLPEGYVQNFRQPAPFCGPVRAWFADRRRSADHWFLPSRK